MVKNDAVSLSDKVKQANSHTHTDTVSVSVTDTPADTQPKPHNDNDEIKLKLKTADDQPNKKRDTPKELKEVSQHYISLKAKDKLLISFALELELG